MRAIGPRRVRGPHAVSISMIQGAIEAISNPPGLSSGAVRGNDMIHIDVRASDTRTCQLPPSRDWRAFAIIAPNAGIPAHHSAFGIEKE